MTEQSQTKIVPHKACQVTPPLPFPHTTYTIASGESCTHTYLSLYVSFSSCRGLHTGLWPLIKS